ncbi:hypothetical protein [Ensifer sp. LBL]|uniref:PD-(D/E)XK nuclease domain-containing protein n=1 Tax=Ensifer sp. LBL TaxID=2991056 RepID=UPI003D1FF5D3
MNSERALELLKKKRDDGTALPDLGDDGANFMKWRRDTEVAIRKIFGDDSRHVKEFRQIGYGVMAFPSTQTERSRAYHRGLARANSLLSSLIDEVAQFGTGDDVSEAPDVLTLIERICLRFHTVARQLQSRHSHRETLTVADEYDVQDLLHALLRVHFVDIREEEWTPSFAGGSSRIDFLLKDERIVIEVKKTRPSLKAVDVGKELAIDIARYRSHPDCICLVCFVYDPDGYIGNPKGIENDLEKLATEELKVRVIIAPKN